MKALFFILLTTLTMAVSGQSTINLLNGREIKGEVVGEDKEYIKYKAIRDGNTEDDERTMEKDRVFSVVNKDNKETLYYTQDSTMGNERSIDQMRSFILGEQHAWKSYKAGSSFIMASGLSAGGLISLFSLAPSAAFFGFAVPPLAMFATQGILPVQFTKKNGLDDAKVKDEHYLDGFEMTGKSQKMRRSFQGALVGFAAGVVSYVIIKPEK